MTDGKIWTGVTADVFRRLRSMGESSYGSRFDPSDSNEGTVTTDTPVGRVVLAFAFDADESELRYRVRQKPPMVPEFMIWDGIDRLLQQCKAGDQFSPEG
jgi:hypothetical protein